MTTGDGVTKDTFSLFFEKVYEIYDGEYGKIASPTLEEEDLETIAEIITHAISEYKIFPLKLSNFFIRIIPKLPARAGVQTYQRFLKW